MDSACDLNQMREHSLDDNFYFLRLCYLKNFLREVVSKLIYHYIMEERQNFAYQSLPEITLLLFFIKPPLEHTAASLVIAVELSLVYYIFFLL
jgi:hypothetical protein